MNNHMITATTPYGYRYYIYTLIVYIYYHYIVLFDIQTICTFLQSANYKPYDFSSVYTGVCLHLIIILIFSKPWYLFHLHTLPKIHLFEYSPTHSSL